MAKNMGNLIQYMEIKHSYIVFDRRSKKTILLFGYNFGENCLLQIRQTEELVETTKHDLEKASRAKQGTLSTLRATEEEVRKVDREVEEAQARVQAMDKDRRLLEDQVLLLLREQVTAEKSGEYTDRIVAGLREQVDKLEARMAQAQEQMAAAAQVT